MSADSISLVSASISRRRMPFFMSRSSLLSITCERLPNSSRIVFVFRTSAARTLSSGRCCVEEVAAVDDGVWLQLTINATVALLHSAGIPWNVEVEHVPAVRL